MMKPLKVDKAPVGAIQKKSRSFLATFVIRFAIFAFVILVLYGFGLLH
jgi:hypothetical protein